MHSNFSSQVDEIITKAKAIALEFGLEYIGTECLLLAMFETQSSVCHFLLSEYNITAREIKELMSKIIILRKYDIYDGLYSLKLIEILEKSNLIRLRTQDKYIFDEHLFFGLLLTKQTVALSLLKLLRIDINDLYDEFCKLYTFDDLPTEHFFESDDDSENFLVNLTQLAKRDTLAPFVERPKYKEQIIKILSKKQKHNPLLIGNAGVGKTAIVEGIARHYLEIDPKVTIYNLDLGQLISGTKYRGDLEQRLSDALDILKEPKTILFIDEIHNILGAGSSEGSLDIANILKPLLSRAEIRCIGATTLEEYYNLFSKDRALARRFQNIYIEEPTEEETFKILSGICYSFSDFHNITYTEDILKYIIKTSHVLHNRKFPDKAIDVLDECGYVAAKKNLSVDEEIVDEVVFAMLGINYHQALGRINNNLTFPELNKFYLRYFLNINRSPTIANIQITTDSILESILADFSAIFSIKNETMLRLDLGEYKEPHSLSALLGAPPGYIGFDMGGKLTNHVLKFPINVIVIKNFSLGNIEVKSTLTSILQTGQIDDHKGREINFSNTIFIFVGENKHNPIGFLENNNYSQKIIPEIEIIIQQEEEVTHHSTFAKAESYLEKLAKLGFNLQLDFDIKELSSLGILENTLDKIYSKGRNKKITLSLSKQKEQIIIK